MSYQEKRSLVNLISAVAVPGIYFWIIFQDAPQVGLTTDELLKFWGTTMITYIPIAIVARIVIHILFGISNTIITKEKMDKMDERDRIIELKSKNIGQAIFAIGLVGAMATQAMDYSANALFVTILVGGVISEIFENSLQLMFYRRGF
ncbi:hypothetical protein BFP97_02200 [Roseivirga sp. 4D4]|uniref:hypothetical protein n=1 Tax=Roseivirga sp. 4D4 TaxID=1889784 RepID=UPI0008534685|nr:hypothetical protein [Roseivirga sp. 4D4]OEK00395.1 hypothetical protein BFP97_02200 [Roseivirga sp. 4D4]